MQALADLPAGDVLAFAADERRGVHLEIHLQRGLIHADGRQAHRRFGVAHREADVHALDAGDGDDVAGVRLFHRAALQALEREHLGDLGRAAILIAIAQHDGLPGRDRAVTDAADADAADIGVVIERRDLQLQRRIRVGGRRRHVLEHGLEQRRHVRLPLGEVETRPALQGRGVDHREVELRIGRAELVEELEGLVHHPARPRAGTVDLVDDHDGLEAQRQRLARDEARLRHGAFDRIHQQQHAVDHGEHALDFAAEVRMARACRRC